MTSTSAADPMKLVELQNEVLRRIGRNVVNFQKLEALLKASIVRSQVQGDMSDLKRIVEQKERSVSTQTMGNLVGEHLRVLYGEAKGTSTSSFPEDIPWISYSVKLKTEESFLMDRSSALAKLVEGRNKLIHQLLPGYDDSSAHACETMIKFLDEQHAFLVSEYAYIKQLCEAMIDLGEEAILKLRKEISGKSD
jgi:hypothetical protein